MALTEFFLLRRLCARLLPAGLLWLVGPACLAFECHSVDSTCSPSAASALLANLNSLSSAVCLDPEYAAPDGALVVSSADDSGGGSLREAILNAPPGGAIDLTAVPGTIVLASNLPTIAQDVGLYGACGPATVIDGAGLYRPFRITGGAVVSLQYLTLQNGIAPGGPGNLNNVVLSPAGGGGGGAGLGGAIFADAGATVTQSNLSMSGNSATDQIGAANDNNNAYGFSLP